MRKVLLVGALLAACVSLSVDASQGPRVRTRAKGATSGGGAKTLITWSDFTPIGYIVVPEYPGGYGNITGQGIAVKTEPSDSNNLHIYLGGDMLLSGSPYDVPLFAIRYQTPQDIDSNYGSYTLPTIVADYGEHPWKRASDASWTRTGYDASTSADVHMSYSAGGNDSFGFNFVDADGGKLYFTNSPAYDGAGVPDDDSTHFVRAALNYASPSSNVGQGPWKIGNQKRKSLGGSVLNIPTWFQTYVGGKPLALCGAGYQSIQATGDVSLGPSCTAIDIPTTADNTSSGNGTPLFGYWPWTSLYVDDATGDRAHRPDNFLRNFFEDTSWPLNRYGWDFVMGTVWIDTPTKTGILTVNSITVGAAGYVGSTGLMNSNEIKFAFYSPYSTVPYAGGNRWNVQPYEWSPAYLPNRMTTDSYPAPYTTYGTATSITSSSSDSYVCLYTTGTAVVTLPSHGLSVGNTISITGNSIDNYNGGWQVFSTPTANTFTICNPNGGPSNVWPGGVGTGGEVRSMTGARGMFKGMAWHEATGLLFIRFTNYIPGPNSRDWIQVLQGPTS